MRSDLANHLVHFTKGDDEEGAFQTLKLILREQRVLGAAGHIRGGTPCVCFSEAPLKSLEYGLINQSGFSRYAPFGLLFSKGFVFGHGGRPVIYQPESEFIMLPEAMRWRHVRFEPTAESPIDFTWEREWRLPTNELRFQPHDVEVVLPDATFRDRFVYEAERDSFYTAWAYTEVVGEDAWAYDTGNPWKTVPLRKA
jgi:hypothetical protein